MRNLVIGVLLGICMIAAIKHCTQVPVHVPASHSMRVFKDLRSAELYGATRAVQCSQYYECGGDIFRTDRGEFVVGRTHSNYAGDELDSQDYDLPPAWVPVADFHTHACLPVTHANEDFSDEDVKGDIAEGTEGVMVDMCTGDVHLFVPGVTPIGEKISSEVHDTPGEIIGHVLVDGSVVEPDQGY